MSAAFKEFQKAVIKRARASSNNKDLRTCMEIFDNTNEFLRTNNVIGAGAALERFENAGIQFNSQLDLNTDIGVEKIYDLVKKCRVPTETEAATVVSIARILGGGQESITSYFSRNRDDASLLSSARVVGRGAVDAIGRDSKSLESFGIDMDRVSVDNRLNIAVTLLRAHKSLIERVLPRVASETNIVTIKIPAPEVYNLDNSQNASSAIRNNPITRYPFVTLYKNPTPVDTTPQQIVFNSADDTGSPSYLVGTTALRCGTQANLFDLSLNSALVGWGNVDFTDLISEGGAVASVLVQVQATISSSLVTELYLVPTRYIAGARYTAVSNSQLDSGDRGAGLKAAFAINSATLMSNGSANSLFSAFTTPDKANLNIQFNSTLNLKNGNISGGGSVTAIVSTTNGTSASGSLVTALAAMTFTVLAFTPDLKFSEENLRKTNIAVRMNERQQQFEIPVGRMFVVDYSLQQQTPEDVLTTMSNVMSIGNDARSLNVIQSVMADVAAQLLFQNANPDIDWTSSVSMDYAAGTICLPYIYNGSMDFTNIAVFRETERLAEIHGRMRALLLSITALIHTNSLYLENLGPNETVVYKIVTSTVLKDVIFGIDDYHNVLNDKAPLEANSDYSMFLPNGVRLDIVATNFTSLQNTVLMFPVREMKPDDVTSFATLQDSGTFVAQYTPVSNGAANKRVVTSSREIPFVTNPIGAVVQISGIAEDLPLLAGTGIFSSAA